ncbi:UDP-glucose/GDP-mannose dehydrogenase family protein [Streptomyces sp. MST-110588]|uniref:UDP-glucose dehydrogenase family protein n=1 Tax=Streptomyces sp. MST-110588 TaxID=2833628 RepID=UPI001F5DFC7E|nr:UDP-glucose/GDP-mannose dehydrogenase family protein [Streptomyces sp. MST-110588]UNO43493.1 UDP-glucose/GDP-mannose dehydrogenase family protein [Streptomyces sp. MST-110588]
MRVAVVGQGYVGLTGAVALTHQGHQVTGIEQDPVRLRTLNAGRAPVFEPGLPEQLSAALATGRLRFTDGVRESHRRAPFDIVLITVGTPPGPEGAADLTQVRAALDDVLSLLPAPRVVLKSTVPPGTSGMLVDEYPKLRERYAYNPEFLNQGSALDDWAAPARIVAGAWSRESMRTLRELYAGVSSPWVETTPTGAEMIKYASNAFLATKISFANEVARMCCGPDIDIDHVMQGVGYDPRIGHAFLQPGLGFGDSCLPKDTAALARWASSVGIPTPLLHATISVNEAQAGLAVQTLRTELDGTLSQATIAVLGVRYEPWSDDLRAAPSRTVVPALLGQVGRVRVWDPATDARIVADLFPGAEPAPDLTAALDGAHAVLLLTEWPQAIEADWSHLASLLAEPRLVIDGKNCLHSEQVTGLPIRYRSVGTRLPAPAVTGTGLSDPQLEA